MSEELKIKMQEFMAVKDWESIVTLVVPALQEAEQANQGFIKILAKTQKARLSAEAQLAKLQWVKITPETMPEDVHKEVLWLADNGYIEYSDSETFYESGRKYTHWAYSPPLPDKEKP